MNFASLFPAGIVSEAFNLEIETQAKNGRISHAFTNAVSATYGVAIPTSKAAFLTFRAQHVAYVAEGDYSKIAPSLWVKGHVKRAAIYNALDAIAAALTGVDKMADSADWASLFAPTPRKSKVVAGQAKIVPSVLDADTVAPNVMDETHDISEVSTNVAAIIAGLQAGTVSMLDATSLQTALTAYFRAIVPVQSNQLTPAEIAAIDKSVSKGYTNLPATA